VTQAFDPIRLLQALDRHGVTYIVIGALGRVIHGSGELTDGLDIVPSLRPENLRRLALALDDLGAERHDGRPAALEHSLAVEPVLELRMDSGELTIVAQPAGTRGYEDLRRAANREPLGRGVRPSVASIGDHARMLAGLGRDEDKEALRMIRRLIELDRQLERGRHLEQ
jgi:hypothetical protein